MGLTLCEGPGPPTIDSRPHRHHGSWTIVEGGGSLSLGTNNDGVTRVTYRTSHSFDLEGDRIRIAAVSSTPRTPTRATSAMSTSS